MQELHNLEILNFIEVSLVPAGFSGRLFCYLFNMLCNDGGHKCTVLSAETAWR